ncbi:centrosomal protein of 131 kDa isoform X2 [Aricia agestis]|uniref:centrosomal protein of 131 kDa isoform X2 n=1 Tax=Aricia agestis TaxID=91739 RepID=UPI001C20B88B|nr:centrosomal protein of 131 kDa isoform X2 [Aricia agestis]
MSKENNNLRLLGSPVNLTYRSKKKEERKNTRNRPRSALQNSTSLDCQERYRRPYSADTKDTNSPITIKVLSPTQELLNNRQQQNNNKDICSNASDFGSEDTFMSLGTKIKAKAQSSSKNKNPKNYLKYRNIARRGRKMEADSENAAGNDYELDIRITEKLVRSPSPQNLSDFRTSSPTFKYRNHQLRFSSHDESTIEEISDSFNFNTAGIKRKTDLPLTKQYLSLVEEEENQDFESLPSQDDKNSAAIESQGGMIVKKDEGNTVNTKDRDYELFYEKFDEFNSCTNIATDASSKDSGYPESVNKDEKGLALSCSLPNTTMLKKFGAIDDPKRTKTFQKNANDKNDLDIDNKKFSEIVNHSRLLYKDFFLKKEGHIAIPPNNSPDKTTNNVMNVNEICNVTNENENLEYPPYLVNSSTKAYTSKVIEDYKKEIEAINNLHELTLKDIKTEAISPTPFDIDNMFEQYSNNLSDEIKEYSHSQESSNSSETSKDKNCNKNKQDVSKITTKELIQNYLKIKDDFKGYEKTPKNLKKYEKKFSNVTSKYLESRPQKHLNKEASKMSEKNNIRNQKSPYTVSTPLSARLEELQNNKDVESWISLAAPSPRIIEDDKSSGESSDNKLNSGEDKVEIEAVTTVTDTEELKPREPAPKSNVLDIYSMLKEIDSYGDKPVVIEEKVATPQEEKKENRCATPKDNFMEIFEFLEKVEQSATDALSVVTNTTPQSIPKLEALLRLPQTELAQRLVTASLQLEERSCCIALLQESLTNHKQQMITKVNNLEKQSHKNVAKVKQECEDTIKRHQTFIDQLINDKKTLNHRIEQLVDERRTLEERWRRSAQALEERYRLQLRSQHDKMAAAHQVARQRWVKQKAEKIKELTIKGLEGELREMAERQQKEVADLKMAHAEQNGRLCAKHAQELEELRRTLEDEKETALVRERQLASSRMEKQILELESSYSEQRTRLISEMRAENERVAAELAERERRAREEIAKWREEQENLLEDKRKKLEQELAQGKEKFEEQLNNKRKELENEFEIYKRDYEAEQRVLLRKRETEISAQHKLERDREIEKAIESLEAEAQAGRRELQEALRRNKEQYETELRELGETEQATLRRYQDAQARIRQTEDRCAELELNIGQLETRNRILTEKNSQLESQLAEVRASCEEAWRQKMAARDTEMEDMRRTHEEQMHQLYAKVKVAVARKDSAIQALTRETAKQQEKITLLEQKLAQQRKDFLKSK